MRLNIYVKDTKIHDYIKDQQNYSAYITNLVRKDMENSKPISREEIIELIKRYTGEIKNTPDYEVKEAVKDLLEW